MSEATMFCGECGTPVPAAVKFCPNCGAGQQPTVSEPDLKTPGPGLSEAPPRGAAPPPAAAPQPPRGAAQAAAHRVEVLQPGAGDLAGQIAEQLKTPGVVAAAFAGVVGLLAAIAVGLLLALAAPEKSLLGVIGTGSGFFDQFLRYTVGTTQARLDFDTGPIVLLPILFSLVPLVGTAAGAVLAAPRLAGMAPSSRVLWSAGAGVPLAIGMFVVALVAGGKVDGQDADFALGGVLGLSLLWGAIGGAVGAVLGLRRAFPEATAPVLPTVTARPLKAVLTPLRSLGLLLAINAVIGLVAWEVQTIKGESTTKLADRAVATGLVENVLFAVEMGENQIALGTFAEVRPTGGMTGSIASLAAYPVSEDGIDDIKTDDTTGQSRIFGLREAVPPYVFIPGLILTLALPLLLALYAGFATARVMGFPSPLIAAGWGATVGVVWAIALVVLRAIGANDTIDGGSLFASVLLVGTAAGALGGFLSAGRGTADAA